MPDKCHFVCTLCDLGVPQDAVQRVLESRTMVDAVNCIRWQKNRSYGLVEVHAMLFKALGLVGDPRQTNWDRIRAGLMELREKGKS